MWAFLERGSEDEDEEGGGEARKGGQGAEKRGLRNGMLPQLAASKKLKVRVGVWVCVDGCGCGCYCGCVILFV
jgi:hypothetical protein